MRSLLPHKQSEGKQTAFPRALVVDCATAILPVRTGAPVLGRDDVNWAFVLNLQTFHMTREAALKLFTSQSQTGKTGAAILLYRASKTRISRRSGHGGCFGIPRRDARDCGVEPGVKVGPCAYDLLVTGQRSSGRRQGLCRLPRVGSDTTHGAYGLAVHVVLRACDLPYSTLPSARQMRSTRPRSTSPSRLP